AKLGTNFAYSSKIDDETAWGLTLYGNGGMNTDYPEFDRSLPDCPPVGGNGVFCGGGLGVDLVQVFIQATYAFKMGDFSIGLSPIMAYQSFEARGLGAFAAGGFSSDPANFTNNDHDSSNGIGGKIGITYHASDDTNISLVYQSKIDMSEFSSYAGLFADGGDFDIPSMITLGTSFKPSEDVSVMLDLRQIYYTDVGSVSNAGNVPLLFGMTDGPGFGWDDVTAVKVGVEWKTSDTMTWRLGVASNDNPIGSEDVNLNILAPGVVTKHFTTGFELDLGDGDAFEFAFTYVPNESVQGRGLQVPDHIVTIDMDQLILGASWTFNLGD
ncbi:MAG: outer membrane protein transport protein, partial [Gammaproteobacteria bacterium]|nr:outer membrane protein transport protein [Gammaproteobacteria bacterium]NNJ71948.1 hydrocarbon degradation protein [Enterobacterales bacterium]